MQDWLTERACTCPQDLALVAEGQTWTYGELDQHTRLMAGRLATLGVSAGSTVASLLPNGLPAVCLVHALARLGAVLVPLNTRLTAAELAWQANLTRCDLLVYGEESHDTALLLREPAPSIGVSALLGDGPPAIEASIGSVFQPDRPQAIVFTSGTTGQPKGAVLTFANHFWSATASAYRLGIQPGDRWLSCLPLYHVGGLAILFRSCLYGTAVVLHQRFDDDAFHTSLDRDGVTVMSLVPTMLHRLLRTRRQPWPHSLRLVLLGGAAASADLVAESQSQGIPIATTYGLTEAASQVATMRPQGLAAKPGSVGRPLLFTRVRISDEQDCNMEPGQIGEVIVQGPTVMSGYHRDPQATARTLRNGLLHTGDMGYLDPDGDLWIVQRRTDLIVSGGENILPVEVETALERHPAVAKACVVGIPDPEWGQRVAALVELKPDHRVSEAELLALSRQHLAGYKQPRIIRFTDQLPLTASGKIRRQAVLEQLMQAWHKRLPSAPTE